MLRVAVVAALLGVAACATLPESAQLNARVAAQPTLEAALANPDEAFTLWTQAHGLQSAYTGEEREGRLATFKSNVARIAQHNAQELTWKLALNEFAAMSPEEFAATHLGSSQDRPGQLRDRSAASTPFSHGAVQSTPDHVDWVEQGAVTPVKNQQMCGSCWAFSTTGSIEGINFIKTGKLISLSEQELVDCDTSKDMGCGGGLMDYAFKFVEDIGGLDTERDYPYWGVGFSCDVVKEKRKTVSIDGHEDVPVSDEGALRKAVSQQPVSVAICASDLQFYSSGVVSSCCKALDHGVLLVGYGEDEAGHHFWKIKNSWGEGWGEKGFFRLARDIEDKDGMCGVATTASYPIKTSPNPPAPPPVPQTCDWFGLKVCPVNSECYCDFKFPILDFCLLWDCAPSSDPQEL
mmetsp:Transcript_4994/g.14385  ORF Transcript_4994/g.14385 Transcript_4994/m.14385 type:complete len:406 (-) Transcript_4994:532-1749(-)